MQRVYSWYAIWDTKKFDTLEEAEKEVNRIRAKCIRLTEKYDAAHFILGVSNINPKFGYIGLTKPRNQGGKKEFIPNKKTKRLMNNEETPNYHVKPHIHALVYGYGACTCAEKIVDYLNKSQFPLRSSKEHLTEKHFINDKAYLERQSIIIRTV